MRFEKISLEQLLAEITEIPAGWLDERGQAVLLSIKECLAELQAMSGPIGRQEIAQELAKDRNFLDICRLFLGMSQDLLTNAISEGLAKAGRPRATWTQIERLQRTNPSLLAEALTELGVGKVITDHLARRWTVEDILTERYRLGRGRAVAGQNRGRSVEDEIENGLKVLLDGAPVLYAKRVNYVGFKERTAKCDFAIPSADHPKVVIEAKGFEATGSKQTDVLGDVLKIIEAKAPHTYFFMVTDGRGWHNRTSDLEKLVKFHLDGEIDMIFTRARLTDLNLAVKQIVENE
jgi:hypothetical protein